MSDTNMVGSRGAEDHNSSGTSMVGSRDGSEHNSPGFLNTRVTESDANFPDEDADDSGGTTDATDSISSPAPPAGAHYPPESPDVASVGKQPGTDDHNSEWLNGRTAT